MVYECLQVSSDAHSNNGKLKQSYDVLNEFVQLTSRRLAQYSKSHILSARLHAIICCSYYD